MLESLQAHYHAHNPAWLLALESGQRRELRAAAKGQSEDAMADCVVAGIPSVWALAFPRIAPLGLWRAVGPRGGYTFSVAVDTRDPDRLFVGMRQYGGLYTSHNRGQRFERLDNFPRREKINAIVVAPDDGRILVATNNGLLVSDDSGSTWQLSSPDSEGEDVQSIALAPLDSSIVACGTRKKGGVEFYSETELHGEYNVALNPGFQSGHFHLSLDHGQTWKGLEHQGGIHGIAFSAQHSDKVYLTSADTGLCYCLHGERFRTLEAFPGHSPAYVAVAPLDDDVIVIGGHDGLFASSDGGATWTRNAAFEGFANRVRFVGQNEVQAATQNGLVSSSDAGKTWTAPDGPPFRWSLDFDFSKHEDAWVATDGAGIYRRARGQRDWTHLGQGLPSLPCFDVAAAGGRLFVGTSVGLFIGDMKGQLWRPTGLQSKRVVDVLAHAPEVSDDSFPARLHMASEGRRAAPGRSCASMRDHAFSWPCASAF